MQLRRAPSKKRSLEPGDKMTIQDQQGQHHLHQFLIGTGANDGAGTGDVPVADCVSDIGLADPKTGSSSSALRISFMTQTFPGDSKIDFEVGSESLDDGTVDRRSDPCGPYQVSDLSTVYPIPELTTVSSFSVSEFSMSAFHHSTILETY